MVAVAFVVSVALAAPGAGTEQPPVKVAAASTVTMQAFTAPDLDGEPWSPSPGRPLLVNLWASWCAPCLVELPVIVALHRDHGHAIDVVGIAVDDNVDRARRTAQGAGVAYPLVLSANEPIRERFAVDELPSTFLFAADGSLLWSHEGPVQAGDPALAAALERVVAAP